LQTTGLDVLTHEIVNDKYVYCSFTLEEEVQFTDIKLSLKGDKEYVMFLAYGQENGKSPLFNLLLVEVDNN
jgi:hypothetical protein